MEALERLLEVVRRELDADDARVEIGGAEPEDPHLVWSRLPQGWRVVAIFRHAPADRDQAQTKLDELLEAFHDVARRTRLPRAGMSARRALDEELLALADRVGADHAVIVDESSPVLWGSSDLERVEGEETEALIDAGKAAEEAAAIGVDLAELLDYPTPEASKRLRERGVDREPAQRLLQAMRRMGERNDARDATGWGRYLRLARAVAAIREGGSRELRQEGFGYLSRRLADIYWAVLSFPERFSELHVEAALIHAAPRLERLLEALPPEDPGSGGGGSRNAKVIQMPRR